MSDQSSDASSDNKETRSGNETSPDPSETWEKFKNAAEARGVWVDPPEGSLLAVTQDRAEELAEDFMKLLRSHRYFDALREPGFMRSYFDELVWQGGNLEGPKLVRGDDSDPVGLYVEELLFQPVVAAAQEGRRDFRLRPLYRPEVWPDGDAGTSSLERSDHHHYRAFQRQLSYIADRVYLDRYDLPGARRMAGVLQNPSRIVRIPEPGRRLARWPFSFRLALLLFLLLMASCVLAVSRPESAMKQGLYYSLIGLLGLASLAHVWCCCLVYGRFLDRVIQLRMIGAIAVGYLPLAMTDEGWRLVRWIGQRLAESLAVLQAICRSAPLADPGSNLRSLFATGGILALLLAAFAFYYGYTWFEIRNVLLAERVGLIHRRARDLVGRGLCYAIVLGMLGAWPMAWVEAAQLNAPQLQLTQPDLTRPEVAQLKALESAVPQPAETRPKVDPILLHYGMVLFGSPIALCIGVLLQVLWEDKPITSPL
jgi:hypothetical protein